MSNMELERCVKELRSRPLLLLCRTPKGREQVMTVGECAETGAVYIRLVADDLDELLAAELGEKCNFSSKNTELYRRKEG